MLIIFDLDGTLYRTDVALAQSVIRAASEVNLPHPDARAIVAAIGDTMDDFCRFLYPDSDPETLRSFRRRVSFWERELIPSVGVPYDGVREMIKELRSMGHRPVICTNGSLEYATIALSALHLADMFEAVEANRGESQKAELVARLLSKFPDEAKLIVGDRKHDVEAAGIHNVPSIGVTYGYGREEPHRANFTADTPADIVSLVCQCAVFAGIADDLAREAPTGGAVIGVNGVDASGKTTFARSLCTYLRACGRNTQLIHLDDFHNPREVRRRGSDEIDAYIHNAFNLELLVDELLAPAKEGREVNRELMLLDIDTDRPSVPRTFHIDREGIVVLEGVLLYREPLDSFFTYRVFLDIAFDEVLRRAAARDIPKYGEGFLDRYRRKYIPIQQWYLDTHHPKGRCDLVIDNNDPRRPEVMLRRPDSLTDS